MIRTGGFCRSMVRIWTGRGVRAQQDLPAHVEGVLHVARGMVLRDVERLEVVVVELDLGALGHREAHAGEHVHDLVVHPRQGMEAPGDDAAARERQIGPIGGQPGPPLEAVQDHPPALELRLDLGLGQVGLAPHHRPVGGRQAGQGAEQLGEGALLAEVLDPDLLEVPAGGGPLDLLAGAVDDRADARVGHGGTRRVILPDGRRGTKCPSRRARTGGRGRAGGAA